jgi:hypothetical protein
VSLVFIVRMQTDFGIGLIPQFDQLGRLIAANLTYLELAGEFTFTQPRALLLRYASMARNHPLALLGRCQSHFRHEDLSLVSARAQLTHYYASAPTARQNHEDRRYLPPN